MELASLSIRAVREGDLPIISDVLLKIIQKTNDPNFSFAELEEIVNKDTGLTARILRTANSSFYGLCQKVKTVNAALQILGFKTFRKMVINLAFEQAVHQKTASRNFNLSAFWKHSLASASAAQLVGKTRLRVDPEVAYTYGLIHDIGMLVLAKYCSEFFDRAIAMAYEQNRPLHECEKRILGFDSTDVGSVMVEKWQFTEDAKQAIKSVNETIFNEKLEEMTATIIMANKIALLAGFPNHDKDIEVHLDHALCFDLELSDDDIKTLIEDTKNEVLFIQKMFK